MTSENNSVNQTQHPKNQYPGVSLQPIAAPVQGDEDEGINLKDYIFQCIHHWRWFAVSLALCFGLAAFYILKSPKVYTRTAQVVIEDIDSDNTGVSNALSDIGLFQRSSNVANEIMAFKSPALAMEVIEALDLRTDYTAKPFLRPKTLYGDSAVIAVRFVDLKSEEGARLKVRLIGDGKAQLFDFVSGKIKDSSEIVTTLGDTIATPVGRVVVIPGAAFDAYYPYEIAVRRSSLTDAVTIYSDKLSIEMADDDGTVVNFTMKDVSVPRAVNYINTLLEIYNKNWREDKEQMAVATSQFINERLGVIEQELGNVDSDIASYKGEHLVPDVAVASSMFMNDANESTKRQLTISTQIAVLAQMLDYIKLPSNQNTILPANMGIESSSISQQVLNYNTLVLERDKLLSAAGESSPMVKSLDERLQSIRKSLVAALENQTVAYETELRSLIKNDRVTTKKIASSPSQAKYLLSVERQQKVKESLYLFLLQKREENELSMAYTPGNFRVITPPWGIKAPTAPVSRNIFLAAFVLGILIPAVSLFVVESLKTQIQSRVDLEILRTPFVGEIPQADSERGKMNGFWHKCKCLARRKSDVDAAPSLLVYEHGRSVINESFRMVRANLEFITRNSNSRVIMVTSFNPGSGKSFVSINLSAALAVKSNKARVLAIDLDLRRASLSNIVDKNVRGVSDYIVGVVDDYKSLILPTKCDGLYVLPVGTIPPNPSELLYSDRLQSLIDSLREEYDYILLDCPPVEIVADTSIITPLADATIFVLRAGLTDKQLLPNLNDMYDTHRFNNLMVLLNGTKASDSSYRKYAYSNYYTTKD